MPALNAINQTRPREDVSDKLIVADAKETPLVAMMKKSRKPANAYFEWPVAGIPAPDVTPVADGAPISSVETLDGSRGILGNRITILRRAFGVSQVAEDVNNPAGVESEFKLAKYNAMTAVKRAIEAAFCGTQDSSLSGSTYTTRGLGSWINNSAQAENAVPSAYRTPSGSIYASTLTSMTEDNIRTIMQTIYEQTGKMGNWDGLFGSTLKAYISKMTIFQADLASNHAVRTFFAKLESNVLDGVIDVVKGDFGQIRIHPTLWNKWTQSTATADQKYGYILDMDDVEMRANQLPFFQGLPIDGSGERGYVQAIVGNQIGNPLKHGAIKGT